LEVGMDGYLSKPLNRDHISFYFIKLRQDEFPLFVNLFK